MDAADLTSEVFYGRILQLITLEFDVDQGVGDTAELFGISDGKISLALVDWAKELQKGRQGQIYMVGGEETIFSGMTLEDISIIKRLIGVVEHFMPSNPPSGTSASCRKQKRSYFIDYCIQEQSLLSSSRACPNGVN